MQALEASIAAQEGLRADFLALSKTVKTHEKQRADMEEALFFLQVSKMLPLKPAKRHTLSALTMAHVIQDEIARATSKPEPPGKGRKGAANKSPAKRR
jgi:hypothetical protein